MNTTVNSAKEDMLNKVPQLTIYFWIIKIMATTVGETVADLFSVKLILDWSSPRWSWGCCC